MTADQEFPYGDPDDHFGFNVSHMSTVFNEHAQKGIWRVGCYIPSQWEVYTLDPKVLTGVLSDWIFESPTALIPTDEQEDAVVEILLKRPDADKFDKLIKEIYEFREPPQRINGATTNKLKNEGPQPK